jgi:hypothetical protein
MERYNRPLLDHPRNILMTQRIRGITDEEAAGPTKDLFEASNIMLGRIANLQRILSHSPLVARWFLPLVAAVRQPTAGALSDVRLRNLACLKTSTVNNCNY